MTEAQDNDTPKKSRNSSSKLPAIQFYPGDWRKDPGIQALDFFDRGVWFEILMLMAESSERGVLLLNGKPMPMVGLARVLGLDNQILSKTIERLIEYGVASRREDGAIFNRRMVRDEEIRQERIKAGSKGGNPNLLNQKPTTQDNQNPTPSSSSSSSSSSSDLSILTREVVCDLAPPPLVLEKPKKIEKPVVPPFTHVRMTPEELEKVKAAHPDKAMRGYYYRAIDDWFDANPKKRGRDCYRTILAWIRRDKVEARGWFTPKKIPFQNEMARREPPVTRDARDVLREQGIDLSKLTKEVARG